MLAIILYDTANFIKFVIYPEDSATAVYKPGVISTISKYPVN